MAARPATAASASSAPRAYTGVAGQLRYVVSGTDAVIGGDVNGDGVSDFNIVLSNVGSLQAADFVQ